MFLEAAFYKKRLFEIHWFPVVFITFGLFIHIFLPQIFLTMKIYFPPVSNVFSSLIFLCIICSCSSVSAQSYVAGQDSTGSAYFYPGVSAVVLEKDASEIVLRNNFTSFWLAINEYDPATKGTRVSDRARQTIFEHALQVSHGFSKSQRWDIGVEMRYAHTRLDSIANSSPWKALSDDDKGGDTYRGLSWLGIRTRIMPFSKLPELTLQGTALFPINGDYRDRRNLGANRIQASLGATFFRKPFNHTYYFLSVEWKTFFRDIENDKVSHTPSVGAYLIREMMSRRLYVLAGLAYSPNYEQFYDNGPLRKTSEFFLGFIGLQYQPNRKFGLYLNTQTPFILDSGSDYIQWVRQSYSAWSLGFRVLL